MPCAELLGGEERLERAVQHVLRHAGAGVTDREHTYWPGETSDWRFGNTSVQKDIGRLDRQLAAVRHRVAAVDREVEQRDFQLVWVDLDAPQTFWRRTVSISTVSPSARPRNSEDDPTNLRRSVGVGSKRLAAREGEEPLRQSGRPLGASGSVAESTPEIGVVVLTDVPLNDLEVAQYNHKKIVEIMRDAAAKLSDGVHLLRRCELVLGFAQEPLGLHSLGYVARDLGETDDLAVIAS